MASHDDLGALNYLCEPTQVVREDHENGWLIFTGIGGCFALEYAIHSYPAALVRLTPTSWRMELRSCRSKNSLVMPGSSPRQSICTWSTEQHEERHSRSQNGHYLHYSLTYNAKKPPSNMSLKLPAFGKSPCFRLAP